MTHSLNNKQSNILQNLFSLFLCSFFLLIPALYNGYPFVTSDSGAYISNGWLLHVPIDRPITYSIFIRATSLFGLSFWGVVWAQTFIMVYYLKRVSRKLLGDYFNDRIFFCIILLLSAFTSASWVCSHLMPDVFTPILILSVIDFYLSPSGNTKIKVLNFCLIWFLMQQHNSHLLIALIFCVVARLYSLVSKKKWFIRKTIFLFAVTVFSFTTISFFNLWEGNSFRPSASTHVFLMARMAENGILDEFLKEYCPTEHYELCKFQGNTGDRQWNFMWSDNGPIQALGGWEKSEKEFSKIILRTFTRPKYLGLQIYESLEGTLRQIPQFTLQISPCDASSSPYHAIQDNLPRELKEYRTALQQTNSLPGIIHFFNALIFLFALVIIIVSGFLFNKNKQTSGDLNQNFVFISILSFILINAFVTATFSTVVDRLQSRVLWLIPFSLILFLIQFFLKKRATLNTI